MRKQEYNRAGRELLPADLDKLCEEVAFSAHSVNCWRAPEMYPDEHLDLVASKSWDLLNDIKRTMEAMIEQERELSQEQWHVAVLSIMTTLQDLRWDELNDRGFPFIDQ